MNKNSELIRVERSDAERAVTSLSLAFTDYPLLKGFFPDEDRRRKNTRVFISMAVYVGLKYGEVYASSEEYEGISVWLSPGNFPVSAFGSMLAIPPGMLFGMMKNGLWKMKDVGTYIDRMHERLIPRPHMYLQTLGVAPEHQGKGISGKLVRPMLTRLDEENLPCFLETLDEKNVRIYRRFGFEVVEESALPGTDLHVFAMLREAAK